ncbi:hypothetical protein PHMEG_00021366 [Phytophthora megakarya]|uniref:Uncharacterized protein n=1 Tax=Phytophthora megakarya TaxID=4795 RepID=A0A225VLH6_9STRA|nr:hypothetical protein PHMEG_00021366 [Phytophthora megakarya]
MATASRMFKSFICRHPSRTDGHLLKRLGPRDLTFKHFRESTEFDTLEDGSSSVNFSSDFSPSAVLPSASAQYSSYEDTLNIIDDLGTMVQEVWYDHMRKPTLRLLEFVAKNKSPDPGNMPSRVRLTLLYMNKMIDYQSPQWMMALISVLTQEADVGKDKRQVNGRRDQEERREKPRRSAIPYSIRRLIPL